MTASSLDTLINLATDERNAAAVTLGQLQHQRLQSKQQLDALIDYRDEYRHGMQQAMAEGVSVARLDNYQRFLAALDQAIAQQRQALDASRERVDAGKSQWQNRQKKLQSYDTLAERRRAVAVQREARREQRDTDEYAARLYARTAY